MLFKNKIKKLVLFNGSCKTDKVSHLIYLSNFFWLRLVLAFVNEKNQIPCLPTKLVRLKLVSFLYVNESVLKQGIII